MERSKLHPASHCPLIVLSRSDGRSSVAAAAYASRSRMTDFRTGLVHNYQKVPGLLAEGLVHWDGTAEALWNAAEASETRINARVARELRPALPAELPLDDQIGLVRGFCLYLKDRYGVASHWVIHAPTFHEKADTKRLWKRKEDEIGQAEYMKALSDPEMTNLNFHAHIRWTVREVDLSTGEFGKKTRKLDDKATGSEEVKAIRAEWERRTNAALKKAGMRSRIDLRSYKEMAAAGDAPNGLKAQEHVGPLRTAKLRKAKNFFDEPSVAWRNATVRADNDTRWESWFELRRLAREKARLEGESERIAFENERLRRQQMMQDKLKIREAQTTQEREDAISEAGAIDAPVANCAIEAAMAWAATSDEAPHEKRNAFDRVVDLEAGPDPDAPPQPGKKPVRVKRVVRVRQRTRG